MRSNMSWPVLLSLTVVLAACGGGSGGGGGGGGGDGSPQPIVLPPAGGAGTMVVQSTIPIGDFSACNGLGGVHIEWGIDADNNGKLEGAEIAGTGNVCNGSSTTRQILVAEPERPWDGESYPGYYYFVNQIGSTTWERAAGMNATMGDGPHYYYDAYLVTNATGATRTVDLGVSWASDFGTLAAYSGGFNPATPLANLVGFDDSYWGGAWNNVLPITLNPGESRVVVASSWDPFYATGYYVYLTSSTPLTAGTVQAGASGTVGAGRLQMNRVTGLRAGGSYDVTVHATDYTHGDYVRSCTWTDPFWDGGGCGISNASTGDSVANNRVADENGRLWAAAYGATVYKTGAYTLRLTPGSETLSFPLGVTTAGSVSKVANSVYTILDGGLALNGTYTVTLSNVSDDMVTALIDDSSGENEMPCGAFSAGTIVCAITMIDPTPSYVRVTVDGTDTVAGATYTVLAIGPSKFADTLDLAGYSSVLTGQYVAPEGSIVYNVNGAVTGGSYRVFVWNLNDPAVTVSVTDDGTGGGTDSCDAEEGGVIYCTYTAGAGVEGLLVTVDGSASATGSDFNIEVDRPSWTDSTPDIQLGIPVFDASMEQGNSSVYVADVWPDTAYVVTLSNVTHTGVTATLVQGAVDGDCSGVSSGTITCTITTNSNEGVYPATLQLTVDGFDTSDGAWYDILLQ